MKMAIYARERFLTSIDSELSLDGLSMTYSPYAKTYRAAVKELRNGSWASRPRQAYGGNRG